MRRIRHSTPMAPAMAPARIKSSPVLVRQKSPDPIKHNIPSEPDSKSLQRVKTKIDRVIIPTGRIYDGGMTKDAKTKMFWKDGEYYRKIDGCYFKCWPDGNVKDQKTSTHVCWFGKITKKATDEEMRQASIAIQTAMVKAMPHIFYNEDGSLRQTVDSEGDMIYERKLV